MRRVLTYGTYDLLHYGHIRLLKRAKALGDYLIVALSTEEFNELKGKKTYHNYETRKEMLEAIRYVDLVIPEETWEQKVDDVKKYSTIHTIELDPYSIEENQQGKYLLNVNVNDCTMVQIIDNNGCVRDDVLLKWNYVASPAHQVTLGIVNQNGDFQELSFDGTDSTPTNEIENVNEYYTYNSPQQNSSTVTTSQVNQNNYYNLQLDFTNIKQELQTEQNKTVWFLKYVVNFKIDRISKISNTNALIYG